jgi:hypothetical protein
MVDIEDLAEKFKNKLALVKKTENYKNTIVEPIVNKIFNEEFADIFKNISESLNEKLEFNAVNFKSEGRNRFFVEGRFHRIIFQKGKIEIVDNVVNTTIIPLYVWKGVTKHLTPVLFTINPDSQHIKWNFNSPEDYAKNLFSKLVDDDDFFM